MGKEFVMAEKVFKPRKERKSFGLPIVVCLSDDGIKLPARLNNISEGGISFKSNVLFPDGEVIGVEIPYPKQVMLAEGKRPIMLKVKIIWAKDFRDEKDPLIRYIHGCQFMSDESTKAAEGIGELIKLSEKLGEKPMGF
jgi:hypothetical protein